MNAVYATSASMGALKELFLASGKLQIFYFFLSNRCYEGFFGEVYTICSIFYTRGIDLIAYKGSLS